jgi:hypothetical protein
LSPCAKEKPWLDPEDGNGSGEYVWRLSDRFFSLYTDNPGQALSDCVLQSGIPN